MKKKITTTLFLFVSMKIFSMTTAVPNPAETDIIALSEQLLLAVKTEVPTDSITNALKQISPALVQEQLKNDDEKKAFWINIYNAYTQIMLIANPEQYKSRNSFFSSKKIEIAGSLFSLDDIEHGILRRSKVKWGMGYVNTPFPAAIERAYRVDSVDYRIHFALNCGAKSCPPVAFYTPEQIDEQLNLATKNYVRSETEYKPSENTVYLPALFNWFRGDFGGTKKITALLQQYEIIPNDVSPYYLYKKYDWSLLPANYTE